MNARIRTGRVAVGVGLMLVGAFSTVGIAEATPTVPYTDTNAVGYIGLCNQAGQQITSGSINTTPFAWRAVSTQPAQAPYNNAGRTATLFAYQPQQGLLASEWSGEQLTSSARYSNPANPMAAATDGDDSLSDFIQDFPPRWDGFLQLRIYLSTADEQAYVLHYPALNIQVTGETWQAVGGGPVNCQSGTAESLESVVLPKSDSTAPASSSSPSSASAGGTGSAAASSSAAAGSKSNSNKGSDASDATTPGSGAQKSPAVVENAAGTSHALIISLIVAILIVLAAVAYLLNRRRLSKPHSTTKGSSP